MICIDFNKDPKNNNWNSLGFVCGQNVPEMNNEQKVFKTAASLDVEKIMIRINHGDAPTEHFVVLTSNFYHFCTEEVYPKLIDSAMRSLNER